MAIPFALEKQPFRQLFFMDIVAKPTAKFVGGKHEIQANRKNLGKPSLYEFEKALLRRLRHDGKQNQSIKNCKLQLTGRKLI